ncbi:MAG TPA: general secretion pathway protein GspB [Rhizobacter sp.]|nr:general secretion pathway protein GspB [Rhizobacter sp.]
MSYILDALRRADSERERGAVPSLHAKPVPPAQADGDDDEEDTRRSNPLLWAVIGLSLVLVAVLSWQFLGSSGAATEVPVPVAALPPAPPPIPAPPAPRQTPPPAQSLVLQAPPEAPAAQAKPEPKPAAAVSTKPAAAKASAPAADERPVATFNELPDNIRRELPQLVIGGAMYSQTPANRMLILNGQVFHEGDKVAGELVLEQIRLKSAVLAYKGYRYSINY